MSATTKVSLVQRLLSGVYDLLLLAGVLMLVGFLMVPLSLGLNLQPHAQQTFTRVWIMVVVSAYFIWFWTHGGQTLPMKTWKLRLTRHDGGPISLNVALLRLILATAGWGLFGAHFAWALFDRDGQFLHDRMLGTRIGKVD